MENHWLERTTALLGDAAVAKLASTRAVVLGLGGVGSAAAEALTRSGVGHLLLADYDMVKLSNRNRQLIATTETVGHKKASVTKMRLQTLNPEAEFLLLEDFVSPENLDIIFDFKPDFIIDAIDTVTTKLALARMARERNVPVFMSLGMGGRLDPTQLRTGSLADTAGSGCPLARVMRHELRKIGITDCPVVYSIEPAAKIIVDSRNGRHAPSSTAFVPPCAGFSLASLAVRTVLST